MSNPSLKRSKPSPGCELAISLAVQALAEAVADAAGRYYRLVLLAGPMGTGKTEVLRTLAAKDSLPNINVNLELSRRMLRLSKGQRPRQVERLFKDILAPVPGDVVLLDNLEILFDPGLEVEPLRLLQVSSRNRTIVASWNGTSRDGTLTYAEPGHPEFVQFKQTEAVVVPANQAVHAITRASHEVQRSGQVRANRVRHPA